MKFVLTILFLSLFQGIISWTATPHMISISNNNLVYAIGTRELSSPIKEKLKLNLNYMKENDANYPSWYELANWGEDIRNSEFMMLDEWHYSRNPVYDGITPEESTYAPHPNHNLTYVLNKSLKIFGKSTKNIGFYKSMMLRYFINLIGNFHQPLHMITRVSQKHKGGDDCGKLFPVNGFKNLYNLWDQAMGMITEVKRVLYKSIIAFG